MKLTIKFVSATLLSYALLSKAKAEDEVFDVGTVKRTKEEHHPHRSLQLELNQRWKDRIGDVVVVPYTIAPTFSANDVALIDSAVKDIIDRSTVLQFVRRTTQRAYIAVRNDGDGCFSNVGRHHSGTSQILNLGKGCLATGIIQHEFLHAARGCARHYVRHYRKAPGCSILHSFFFPLLSVCLHTSFLE